MIEMNLYIYIIESGVGVELRTLNSRSFTKGNSCSG